jgi:hypothetical protein
MALVKDRSVVCKLDCPWEMRKENVPFLQVPLAYVQLLVLLFLVLFVF